MHFLNQNGVPLKLRRPHLDRYRRMLRESLHNPGLASEQRTFIREQLAQVGQPKVYGSRRTTPASTVQPTVSPEPVVDSSTPEPSPDTALLDADALAKLTKAEILEVGEGEGASVSMKQTKALMIETIISNR
jgi:methylase of polypeptide subunit release factors